MDPIVDEAVERGPVFLVADAQGRYLYVNKAWEDMVGLKRKDVLGKYVHDVLPHSRIDEVIQKKEKIICQIFPFTGRDTPWFGMYTPIVKDGRLICVTVTTLLNNIDMVPELHQRLNALEQQVQFYRKQFNRQGKYSLDCFVGNTPVMQELKSMIRTCARSASVILIEGETGTGKEIVAHSIHHMSNRAQKPFVKLNCAAIPSQLFESELFGYEEGAFTGAKRGGMKGKFELADGGSLFLDEIEQLDLQHQPKLLRVLQEREVTRVGGKKPIEVDCRVIAATNVPLQTMMEAGLFRRDLYYRLDVVRLRIPPLRERRDDIPLIAEHLIQSINLELGAEITGVEPEVMEDLCRYDWPGNVRELRNVIERAINFCWVGQLRREHFAEYGTALPCEPHGTSAYVGNRETNGNELLLLLEKYRWNKKRVAEELGISRTALYKRLKKAGISSKGD